MKTLICVAAGFFLQGNATVEQVQPNPTPILYVYPLSMPPVFSCGFIQQGRFIYPAQRFFFGRDPSDDEEGFFCPSPIFVSSGY